MDIELRQEYTNEDMRWERTGVMKAMLMLLFMGGGLAFTIWILLFALHVWAGEV